MARESLERDQKVDCRKNWLVRCFMAPLFRAILAWGLLIACAIGWPWSAVINQTEPPTVLHLSWGALAFTAINNLLTIYTPKPQQGPNLD